MTEHNNLKQKEVYGHELSLRTKEEEIDGLKKDIT